MNNPQNAFFFEIQPISDNSLIFDELKNQQLFFSYFQVDQNYYLFFYGQESIDIDRIDPFIHILQELDTKERKIRSLRGFFLYALEIIENRKDLQILTTNLKPSFWRNIKTILRQNKKEVLLRFLFGTAETKIDIEKKIQILETQVSSLQQKLINLEAKLENSKYALSATLDGPDATKIIQQDNYMGSYLQENDERVNSEVREVQKVNSDLLSEASKMPLETLSQSQPEI